MSGIEDMYGIPDSARHFVDFPEILFFDELADHIALLEGCEIEESEFDGVLGVWIRFAYAGNVFHVDNVPGNFRIYVEDPNCPEPILLEIAAHLRKLLENGTEEVSEQVH